MCRIGVSKDEDEHEGHDDEAERSQARGIDCHTAHDFEEPWSAVVPQRVPEEEPAVIQACNDAAEQHPDQQDLRYITYWAIHRDRFVMPNVRQQGETHEQRHNRKRMKPGGDGLGNIFRAWTS